MDANDRVSDANATAHNASKRNASKVIAIVEIRNEHLKERFRGNFRRRHILDDGLKQRCHVFAVVMKLAHGETILRARIDNREIELLIRGF